MTSQPTVSVLMTVYNRERYIARAIESVLGSTYEDFELVLVDDGSEDRSLEIAERYPAQDARVRIHRNEENLGDYPNRNHAAELARGKYLKYVDSDDLIYPHGLEVMVQAMEAFPEAGFGLCCQPSADGPYPAQVTPEEAYRAHFFGGSLFMNAPLSAIIRKSAFEAVGGFSGRRYIGDSELWLVLGARFPIVKMPRDLTWWRTHGDQEVTSGHANHAYASLRFRIAIEALTSPHCPLSPQDRERALFLTRRFHARKILWSAAQGNRVLTAALYRESAPTKGDVLRALLPRPLARRFRFVS